MVFKAGPSVAGSALLCRNVIPEEDRVDRPAQAVIRAAPPWIAQRT